MQKRIKFFSLFVLALSAQGKAECPLNPSMPDMKSQRTYTGEYKNLSYGFSVVIPLGLRGVGGNNPAYQKGFTIFLQEPRRTLAVFADTNSLEYADPRAAAVAELALFKQGGLQVLDEQIAPTKLGRHTAATLSFRYNCSG